ncbi:ABC transporter substrate-binding protein [Roseomonas sp. 18066]|uniref:substrate-binding periplasmic protein n=1 Tax=Roseomonas sp. 18066 TaxID=2681412 RepID=UPI00135C9FD5|nr:transporter substrate-binding domain-containing protein [Roseomonas sp. 18066]
MRHRGRLTLLTGLLLAAGLLPVDAARAADVRMLIGNSLPPYIIERENRGVEYDIVKEALALRGHRMVPSYVPFARIPVELERDAADAAMTVNDSSGIRACFSDVHIIYRNYAISLASRGLKIEAMDDLRGKSIRAFQNARLYLGPAFNAVTADNPGYAETANQQTQNAMLFAGRVDVVVGDINIFNWFNRTLPASAEAQQPVALHALFEPVAYRVGFRDATLCAAFNGGLAELRASGRYDAIVAGYTAAR